MTETKKPTSGFPGSQEGGERTERHHRIVRTFMTQSMADEDILNLATGRERELERIVGAVERSWSAAPGTLQHLVLYGNRGFGKSFMTRRVQIEVARRWPDIAFLLLPEEQHSLQRDSYALLETFALMLADNRSGGDTAYAEGHFRWPTAGEAADRWKKAETGVERALDAALPGGGVAVVVVENFDTLLQRLFREEIDEQRLRRWLDRKGNRLMLFATATGTVDMNYDRPLFHAFESVRLEPWSSDDCIEYFNRLRAHQGLERLGPQREAKARAVADFIGGNPRLAQLLGDVLETEDALEVAEIMAALTDRLADYYRRRIEDLAPLSIGLLDALIRGGEPASQTELAARVGAKGQSEIARVMSELQRADIVRGTSAPDTREKLYRVPDRVFVHYYRLRQGSRTALKTPLVTILDFLRSFYSPDERRQQSLSHLDAGRLPEAGLFSRLAREGMSQTSDRYTRNFVKSLRLYLEAAPEAIEKSAEQIATLLDGETPEDAYALCQGGLQTGAAGAVRAVVCAQALYRLYDAGKAREVLETALKSAQGDSASMLILVDQLGSLVSLHDNAEAARLIDALEGLDGDLVPEMEILRIRLIAWRKYTLGQYDKSMETAKRGAELATAAGDSLQVAAFLRYLSYSLCDLGQLEEVVETTTRAAELAAAAGDLSEEATCLHYRAYSLGKLGRHEEAVETATRAAETAAAAGDAGEEAESLCRRAYSLRELGRHEEAWISALASVDIAREASDDFNLGWAILECVRAATHLSRPEVVALFDEWVRLCRTSEVQDLPEPRFEFGTLFVAAARANTWTALDKLLEEHVLWLASGERPFYFHKSDGENFARIGEENGRAAGYEAMAEALPRIAAWMERLPLGLRDPRWLPDIAAGFAEACRDPGLLRDVATLLTPELSSQAKESADLFMRLADVDEAVTPEIVLARMDPDIATLIRRLRDLPDPAPAPSDRKRRSAKR